MIDPGAPTGRDFNLADAAVHRLDSDAEPWSVHLEAAVSGRFEEARLRSAVSAAMRRHPMARARRVPSPQGAVDRWQISLAIERDPVQVESPPDEAATSELRARFESTRVPIDEPVPFRLLLLHRAVGDRLLLNASHAACDGVGALRLLRSIASAYAGRAEPGPAPGELAMFDLAVPPPAGLRERGDRHALVRQTLMDAMLVPPARLCPDGPRPDDVAYRFEEATLDAELTSRILAARPARSTLNDRLVAGLHRSIEAWNAEHGASTERISTMIPVNVRPIEARLEGVGNATCFVSLSTDRAERRSVQSAVHAVARQTRQVKEAGPAALREILAHVNRRLPTLGHRFVGSAVLSNFGRIGEALSFAEAGPVIALRGVPPCPMPLGLGVGAVGYAGQLFLSFRYRTALWSPEAAARFVRRFTGELAG